MTVAGMTFVATQAVGEYAGSNFVRDVSRNLFTMVMDNLWYIVGGLAVVIVVWLYIRK